MSVEAWNNDWRRKILDLKENLNKFLIFARKSRKQSNPQDYNEVVESFLDLVLEGKNKIINVSGVNYW